MPLDAGLIDRLYTRAHAGRWGVPVDRFAEALHRAADRGADPATLHLEDLALACACAEGDEAAWEHFIRELRPVLYRAADALDPGGGARDLADGIYGELFERSLFRYFHGRSSLATWLRAVLAQRQVDRIRAQRRLEPLPDDDTPAAAPAQAGPYGPERSRSLALMHVALKRAVEELPPRDRLRLACYYAQQLTLAETGKLLGEHEATCSRHLARARKALRTDVERRLRDEHGLSDAAIAEAVASVTGDPGELDLADLLCKESPRDRSTVREPR